MPQGADNGEASSWQADGSSREVIERKLLVALDNPDNVALLASHEDLHVLMLGLENISGANGQKVYGRAQELLEGLKLLHREAFGEIE